MFWSSLGSVTTSRLSRGVGATREFFDLFTIFCALVCPGVAVPTVAVTVMEWYLRSVFSFGGVLLRGARVTRWTRVVAVPARGSLGVATV